MEFMEVLLLAVVAAMTLLAALWIWQKNVTERESGFSTVVTGMKGGEAGKVTAYGGIGGQHGDSTDSKTKVEGMRGGKADTVDAIGQIDAGSFQHAMLWKGEYDRPAMVTMCDIRDINTTTHFSSSQIYNMHKNPKGFALIVNNFKFKKAKSRDGTNIDAKALSDLFNSFGFEVKQRNDLTAEEIRTAFSDMAKECKDGSSNCFCGIILSHGREGGVDGTDGQLVKTKEVMDMFHGENCPGLLGKPKLFFIQACQGEKEDRGCDLKDNSTVNDDLLEDMKCQTDSSGHKIPTFADFFLAVSTVPGYVSYRNPDRGSFFITAIVRVFSELAAKYDLNHLMTRVNHEVVERRSQEKCVQMSRFESTLRKTMYFFPGLPTQSVNL